MPKVLLLILVTLCIAISSCAVAAPDYPARPVPFTAVRLTNAFWGPRLETNHSVTVWYDFAKCEETGRIANFEVAGKLKPGEFVGCPFDDSDVFKVIEGAAYTLALHPDKKLDRYLDDLIKKIAAAQEPDGYLYTARTIKPTDPHPRASKARWLNERGRVTTDQDSHELYNLGHLYEAAVAHYQATGKRTLLDVAIKSADLVSTLWGPGKLAIPSGHQEIEIGLVKLYRVTGNRKYLDTAKFLLDCRGRRKHGSPRSGLGDTYYADHKPVVDQTEAVGHSVRSTYMYTAMADVAVLTGDKAYSDAVDRIWTDVVETKLYITGGIGSLPGIEGFGSGYHLPNNGYNETCAAIGNALWNYRMFLLHRDAKYIDVFERIIYNGFLSGVSLSGNSFFYPNPLVADGVSGFNHGSATREPWFGCSCCPVNIVRFLPSIPGCFYAQDEGGIYVNLFASGEASVKVSGSWVKLVQDTSYPWDGRVRISVTPSRQCEFALRVRVPGWATGRPVPSELYRYLNPPSRDVVFTVNGEPCVPEMHGGYAVVRRQWRKGDVVEIDFPMDIHRVVSNEKVEENRGRVALERGPIVYAFEAADNDGKVLGKSLPADATLTSEHVPDLLGGVSVVRATAGQGTLTAVPYCVWSNRGPGEMAVWMSVR